MSTVLLVRHGRTTANAGGVLAGWTPGVHLDEHGQAQAGALGERLAVVPLVSVITSPLERCRETTQGLLAGRTAAVPVHVDERVGECRYGDWTGRKLTDLAREPLWKVVQGHPSAMVFPGEGGESMIEMSTRAVTAVRAWAGRADDEYGDRAVLAVVSHGDVIKAVLADALGLHLDQFQRIQVDPCSVSVVRYTPLRPFVVRMNDVGGDVAALVPGKAPRRRRGRAGSAAGSDAVVGGGAG